MWVPPAYAGDKSHLLRTIAVGVYHDHLSETSRKNCRIEKDRRTLLMMRNPVLLERPLFTCPFPQFLILPH